MKNLLHFTLCMLPIFLFGQSSLPINYQGIARDINGSPLDNQSIDLQFIISTDLAGNAVVYEESHNATMTNAFGLFTLKIGTGTTSTEFSAIDWSANDHYLTIQMDAGSGLTNLGTTQFLAVPYAHHSQTAVDADNADFATQAATALDDNDKDPQNELQNLSVAANTLELSIDNGNTITLPTLWEKDFSDLFYTAGRVDIGTGATSGFGNLNVGGTFNVYRNTGNQLFWMTNNTSDNAFFQAYNSQGFPTVRINSNSDGDGFFAVYRNTTSGDQAVAISLTGLNAGRIRTYGPNGNRNTTQTHLLDFPNNGYVSVSDATGNLQAGMFVNSSNQGIVFGDTKNFRMKHPTEENKEIWYASLEGPEAGAYERGRGTLTNGQATVYFSEHYTLVANPETFTFNLTPYSATSKGLAIVEITESYFKVQELFEGTGNYDFSWEVTGVRKGYESYQVIRNAIDSAPDFKDTPEAAPPRMDKN